MLNPETNSDSDSLKSKGARWVSAKVQINQTGKKKRKINEDWDTKLRIEKEKTKNIIKTNRVLKTDSYEIDWATERNLPIKLYLELEDQPASKTEKTIIEPTQKNKTRE